MGARENKVESHLKQQLINEGGDCRKWVSPGRDGVPDQICFMPTRHAPTYVFFVEVKTVDGVLSVAQTREHNRLRDMGLIVCTVYGLSGVEALMVDIREYNKPLAYVYGQPQNTPRK